MSSISIPRRRHGGKINSRLPAHDHAPPSPVGSGTGEGGAWSCAGSREFILPPCRRRGMLIEDMSATVLDYKSPPTRRREWVYFHVWALPLAVMPGAIGSLF